MNDIATNDNAGNDDRGPDDEADPGQPNQRRERKSEEPKVSSDQHCLAALSRLPGLLAMGLIQPATANAMRGAYHEILQYQLRAEQKRSASGIANEDLLAAVRKNPALLSQLEPLLTDEQFKFITEDQFNANK